MLKTPLTELRKELANNERVSGAALLHWPLFIQQTFPIWRLPDSSGYGDKSCREIGAADPGAVPGGSTRKGFFHSQARPDGAEPGSTRSEEHTSELASLLRISNAVICLKKNKHHTHTPILS